MKIIMAFPGSGKTYYEKNCGKRVLDLDSSKFRKTKDWEEHYVDIVEQIIKEDRYDVLLICPYTKVMQIMKNRSIDFTAEIPYSENNRERITIKEMMFGRYALRDQSHIRNPETWMYQMKKNYDMWTDPEEIKRYTPDVQYINLEKRYLSDIIH